MLDVLLLNFTVFSFNSFSDPGGSRKRIIFSQLVLKGQAAKKKKKKAQLTT
jgi:hypothetical protein